MWLDVLVSFRNLGEGSNDVKGCDDCAALLKERMVGSYDLEDFPDNCSRLGFHLLLEILVLPDQLFQLFAGEVLESHLG